MKYTLLFFTILLSIYQSGLAQLIPLPNPASGYSFTPKLHSTDHGQVYLSWQTKSSEKKHHLFFSKLNHNQWSTPRHIASEDKKWFVNWADFPAITTFGKKSLAVNYLQKSTQSTYAYDAILKISNDQGKTWQKPFKAHQDHTATEHGFVSLAPATKQRFLAIWLDGRETTPKEHNTKENETKKHGGHDHSAASKAMTLRAAFFNSQGKASQEVLLDHRVCDCCQTSLARTSQGYIAVYRNRSAQEIRDIGFVTYQQGHWSQPQILHNDGWKINGCPVNGPAVAATRNHVAVAWFTMANNRPKVKIAFSDNNGTSFGLPIQVNEATPIGRVATALLPNGDALVVWMETDKSDKTFIKLRKVSNNGVLGKSLVVSKTNSSRASGFPQIVLRKQHAIIAWTHLNEDANGNLSKQIKTVIYPIK